MHRWGPLPLALRALLAVGVLTTALVGAPAPAGAITPLEVAADVETDPVPNSGDAADDMAIWIHPTHPALSVVIGNDKKGGIEVYDLAGKRIQRIEEGFFGNVDVRRSFPVAGRTIDLVGVARLGLRFYEIDPGTRQLTNVTDGGTNGSISAFTGAEGFCFYRSPASGRLYAFVNARDGRVAQFELSDSDADGLVNAVQVRAWNVGSEVEGCVADDELGNFYISEEDVGIWKYGAEPTDPTSSVARTLVDTVGAGGNLAADVEGLTIVYQPDGTGYLMASAQAEASGSGPSYIAVYRREGTNAFVSTFRVTSGTAADGCSRTDGIDAVATNLGPSFPSGLFVCQDHENTTPGTSGNQNFKYVRLEKAVDLDGTPLPPPPPPPPTTLVFGAEADARVAKNQPKKNFGNSSRLEADNSPVVESYLRFSVTGADTPVQRATLRLFVTDKTGNGPQVFPSLSAWSETGITWNNRPVRTGAAADNLGPIPAGAYAEWDVTALVPGNGTYSFNLVADSSDGADFNSKEAASNRPQLVIETEKPLSDATPPETMIDSGPSGTVSLTSATFSFSATEAGSSFECRLDGAAFTPCTSPTSYSGLADGSHTFGVRATDPAGNTDPTPASRTWTIDTTEPTPPPPADGIITTLAGTGTRGSAGDGGPATSAQLSAPRTMAADAAGNVFVADTENHRIRKVDTSGTITRIAGTGVAGYSGDGGPATNAQLNNPHGVAVDGAGNVYVADSPNHRIRKISPAGIITTVAGTGTAGYNGDGIPATSARLAYPKGVEIAPDGSLYIGDANNHRIRRVDASGEITTVAGSGVAGFSGDGGPATLARLNFPRNVAFDAAGNFYIADNDNYRVRRVDTSGVITTVAGTGVAGYSGDGGPATSAQLNQVRDVAVDGAGNLYIADQVNHRVRRVDPAGTITTFAGTGVGGYNGDDRMAATAQLAGPRGVAVDSSGRVYIGDTGNHRIRRVS